MTASTCSGGRLLGAAGDPASGASTTDCTEGCGAALGGELTAGARFGSLRLGVFWGSAEEITGNAASAATASASPKKRPRAPGFFPAIGVLDARPPPLAEAVSL